MSVNLSKGGNVSLSKEAPGLVEIAVGLGWDVRQTDGNAFDIDASAFVLNDQNKVRSDKDFIFYNNLKSTCGHIEHLGDNRTGVGAGDDEVVRIKLAALGNDIQKVVLAVTIHDGENKKQSFGQIQNAFIRVLNTADQAVIARYDLSEDASTETAMIFGEIYRHNSEWKFRAVGQGFAGGLAPLARHFGVDA
ncbi:MAG: TerD family protein [Magnetococcales bacterium]|nr:TerD family protein [Magnetococcales bacterium]MBF0116275.1 TerD family protein [Magnetococcales bacterium]